MVAKITALKDPAAARRYYGEEDYYLGDAKAPSTWHGRAARNGD